MVTFFSLLVLLAIAERIAKFIAVELFFAREAPTLRRPANLISILIPVESSIRTARRVLSGNIGMLYRIPVEFLLLVDENDQASARICQEIMADRPEKRIKLIKIPPTGDKERKKAVMLAAGTQQAGGDVICVLACNARLQHGGLEAAVAHLDQPGTGLAYSLPCFAGGDTVWERMLSYGANAAVPMTWIPYAAVTAPVAFPGQFFAVRRDVLAQSGGFARLAGEPNIEAAIAMRMTEQGLAMAQTEVPCIVHPSIDSEEDLQQRIDRQVSALRASLYRKISPKDTALFLALVAAPFFIPWLLLILAIFANWSLLWVVVYLFVNQMIFWQINDRHFDGILPLKDSWMALAASLAFPAFLLRSLMRREAPALR